MKKLTTMVVVGSLALCASASENTVRLKRDVLGRALGSNQKQPVLLKKAKVQEATPLATRYSGLYNSMADLYNPNEQEPSLGRYVVASFTNDNSTGYADRFDFNERSNIPLSEFKTRVQDFEDHYTSVVGDYDTPQIKVRYRGIYPYETTPYSVIFGADMYNYQGSFYRVDNEMYMTKNGLNSVYGIRNYAHDNGYVGVATKMFFMSQGTAFPGYVNFTQKTGCNLSMSRGYNRTEELTYNVTLAMDIAPFANVYLFDAACANSVDFYTYLPDSPRNEDLAVGVHDYSYFGYIFKDNEAYKLTYDEEAAILDDFIYHNRTIDFATMAERNNFALANNAISVAPYQYYNGEMLPHDDVNPYFKNGYSYVKPEISAMTYLYLNGHKKVTQIMTGQFVDHDAVTANPSAAPTLAAAMVTDLISKNPFYKWHPEVVKALLLTSGLSDILRNRYTKDNYNGGGSEVGMFRPNFSGMIKGNRSRYWIGDNNDFFKNGPIKFVEKNLVKGKKYKLAISWLNSGIYQIANGRIQQDLDLSVAVPQANGSKKYYRSMSYGNTFEMVEFETVTNDPITIEISRFANNGGRVMLGYNLHEM
ncbi:hypothetical protein SAMN05720764_11368 [Fibrobacter sp. UWH5]|uniref:hypothetical protein n=1 Tax=Fibrobacter sp. UWH5 TaxID=1896211 RepID=UPI000923602D|nr:hypothetical protein [Fibrobacter sp. UWH5]SHL41093.1 hypothetical protein SAMN05720764_11368 [Fibrobacter sp. UWH5]